ncbi:LytR C-terminal domain-containing protein [Rhodococcus sp. NPDC049939]|uniref:LytR C-terminal domain-containing protein n=1 Tax=Rhodococcus sp. NPDC049939 TaxID=3155511 RepID=UPI0033D322C9
MSNPKLESSGPPLRALAMVLIALAILFAGLGFASLSGSDSQQVSAPSATTTASTSTTAPAGAAGTAPAPETTSAAATTSVSADVMSVPVQVFNNSDVTGLAGETAAELTNLGWTVSETGNYSDTTISETTAYYGTSANEQEAATAIAAELGVSAAPRFPGIEDFPAGVIVIVTAPQ